MKAPLILVLAGAATLGSAQITQPMAPITQPILSSAGYTSGGGFRTGITWSAFQMGTQSRFSQAGAWVFGDNTLYQNFWERLTGQPGYNAPKGIDWFRENVVLVTLGTRATGGYSLYVGGVEESREGVTIIRAFERQPTPGSYVTDAQTAPWAMIRVPKRVHQVSLSLLPAPLPLESFVPIPGHGYGIDQPGWQFDPYWSGSRCFVRQENWFSIDDETGYVNYWRRNVSTSVPGLDLDWDRYRLVAIHLGSRPTTGFEIRVDGIDRLPDGTARIRVIEERSTRLSDLRPISTSPFVVIKVERDLPSFTIELTKKGN